MWTCQTKISAAFGTVTRFTRRYVTIKSQYDALVIGGGGFCAEFAKIADAGFFRSSNVDRCYLLLQDITGWWQ